jgi:uncharacterized protein YacL (UPF0231 family)
MKKIVKVLLNQQENGQENYLTFVGGRKLNEGKSEYDNREVICGMSVFFNDTYILNFCLSEDEVQALESNSRVKAIDDLNYILLASGWNITIMKNRLAMNRENELQSRVGAELHHKQGYYAQYVYDEVQFTCESQHQFTEGLRLAMRCAFTEFNVTIKVPEVVKGVKIEYLK